MNNADLCFAPATLLSRLIRDRALSPVEIVTAILERIEAINPVLNAYYVVFAEEALDQARQAERAVMLGEPLGPLHGIPFSVKDFIMTEGVRTPAGSFIHEHRVPDFDAPAVTRLKAAGGIFLGKTTMPEFGWKAVSESPLYGITHNPWKLGWNAGGSSAGAGAACAAGLAPLHLGTDGAGSIRIPAAFNGIFGFKPQYGRIPHYPISNSDHSSHMGPMTRTVSDAALMLSVLAGRHDWDHFTLDSPAGDYLTDLERSVRGLRIAYSPNLGYLPVDEEVAKPVREAVEVFTQLGCNVEEVDPRWGNLVDVLMLYWRANFAGNLAPFLPKWEDRMDPALVTCIKEGFAITAAEYIQARGRKYAYWDQVRPFFETYDLLLTPTTSVAAFPSDRLYPSHFAEHGWDWLQWAGFSYPFNFTGQPAATCPAGFTPDGRPVGLQIIGRRCDEMAVLQAARAFERMRPWAHNHPPIQ